MSREESLKYFKDVLHLDVYKDEQKCAECKGKCCKIYGDNSDGGTRNLQLWFEEWVEQFHMNKEEYGVEPLFDPLVVHMVNNKHLWDELVEKGINPEFCEYRGKDGCMIEWDKRPVQCVTYKCDRIN